MLDLNNTKWTVTAKQWLTGLWYAIVPCIAPIGISLATGTWPTRAVLQTVITTSAGAALFYLLRAAKKDDTADAIKTLQAQAKKEDKVLQIKATPIDEIANS